MMSQATVTLWRPVGPKELELIEASGMREFPPRLPDQPIFYPVLTEAYATQIARDWNVPASGSGFVTRFDVLKSFLDRYKVEHAGSRARSSPRPSIMSYDQRRFTTSNTAVPDRSLLVLDRTV